MQKSKGLRLTSLTAVHSRPFPSIPRGQSPHKNSVSVTLVHSTASLKQGYTSGSRHGSGEKKESVLTRLLEWVERGGGEGGHTWAALGVAQLSLSRQSLALPPTVLGGLKGPRPELGSVGTGEGALGPDGPRVPLAVDGARREARADPGLRGGSLAVVPAVLRARVVAVAGPVLSPLATSGAADRPLGPHTPAAMDCRNTQELSRHFV